MLCLLLIGCAGSRAACSAPSLPRLDEHSVIKFPLTTESAMKKIEDNNTLVRPRALTGWRTAYDLAGCRQATSDSPLGACLCRLIALWQLKSAVHHLGRSRGPLAAAALGTRLEPA